MSYKSLGDSNRLQTLIVVSKSLKYE